MTKKISYDKIMLYLIYILSITFFLGKTFISVGGLIVAIFLFQTLRNRLFYIFNDKIFIFLSVWCIYMFSSSLWAINKTSTISSASVVFLWSVLYLAIKSTLNSKEKMDNFFKFQAYLAIFISANALMQITIGFNIFGIETINGRATDIFSQEHRVFPFILPLYIGIFGAMLSLNNKPKSHYILYSLAIFLVLVAIPISGTRGPLVILAIFIPIIAWASSYRKFAFTGIFVILLTIVSIVSTNQSLQDRLLTLKNPFENQKHLRIAIWKTSIETFKDNPILGVGFKNFRDRQFDYYKPEFQSYEIDKVANKTVHHSHSPWLDILSEQGLVGFCFLLTLFVGIFLNAYKRGVFMFISMFGVLYAFSFFNSTFVLSNSRWSFFMILAITFYALLNNYNKTSNTIK